MLELGKRNIFILLITTVLIKTYTHTHTYAFHVLYFAGLYENIKTIFRKIRLKKDLDQKDELAAAAITGGISSFITTPLDVIKTKLMMQVCE